MKYLKSYFLFLFILVSQAVIAQYTDLINSNRPGSSDGAFSVGTDVLQFEAGAFTVNEDHDLLNEEVRGYGFDFSVRYGVFFEELELILDGTYQNDTQKINAGVFSRETDRSNFRNFTVGAKYLIFDPLKNAEEEKPNLYSYHANRKFKWKSLIPAVAIYAGLNFDDENNPYTAPDVEGVSPRVMISTQNNFAGGWVFVLNLIKDHIGSDDSDFQYIATLTHSFSPKWSAFVESHGIDSDFYADNIFRVGGAYLWNGNLQIDTHVAFNAKDTPTVFSLALGASYRLDFHKDK